MISIDPDLRPSDKIVLSHLLQDARLLPIKPQEPGESESKENSILQSLADLSSPTSSQFQPAIFTSWDNAQFSPFANKYFLQPYIRLVSNVVRNPSDVVFLTCMLVLFSIALPNALLLFIRFNWPQAILQWVTISLLMGPYSILIHNHMHGRGIMSKFWTWLDVLFPYVLGPIMGQTWNSFYYYHKHHHVEENGPADISSTLRYQRDSGYDLARYIGRMIFHTWYELPLYYLRNNNPTFAFKFFAWEISSYAFIVLLAQYNFAATAMVLILPLFQWRAAVMANNWAQHVFIDEDEPTSDFRSSITLIDVVANRHGFNDGYHTSHHLKPSQHWMEHPRAFIQAKERYAKEGALTFQKIDFIKLTVLLLRKEYSYLAAECLIPMGDQIGQSHAELETMLRKRTAKWSEEAIRQKFRKSPKTTSTGTVKAKRPTATREVLNLDQDW